MRRQGRFEDLPVWQASEALALTIYGLCKGTDLGKDFGLADQIRRASVSVMSNIAEGYERETDRELVRFLAMAKGSAGEMRAQLRLARKLEYIGEKEFADCEAAALDVSRQIAGFMRYLRKQTQESATAVA